MPSTRRGPRPTTRKTSANTHFHSLPDKKTTKRQKTTRKEDTKNHVTPLVITKPDTSKEMTSSLRDIFHDLNNKGTIEDDSANHEDPASDSLSQLTETPLTQDATIYAELTQDTIATTHKETSPTPPTTPTQTPTTSDRHNTPEPTPPSTNNTNKNDKHNSTSHIADSTQHNNTLNTEHSTTKHNSTSNIADSTQHNNTPNTEHSTTKYLGPNSKQRPSTKTKNKRKQQTTSTSINDIDAATNKELIFQTPPNRKVNTPSGNTTNKTTDTNAEKHNTVAHKPATKPTTTTSTPKEQRNSIPVYSPPRNITDTPTVEQTPIKTTTAEQPLPFTPCNDNESLEIHACRTFNSHQITITTFTTEIMNNARSIDKQRNPKIKLLNDKTNKLPKGPQGQNILKVYRNLYLQKFDATVKEHNKHIQKAIKAQKETSIFKKLIEPDFTNPDDLENEDNIQTHILNLKAYAKYASNFLIEKGESIDNNIFECNDEKKKTNLMTEYNKWTQTILKTIQETEEDETMYTTLLSDIKNNNVDKNTRTEEDKSTYSAEHKNTADTTLHVEQKIQQNNTKDDDNEWIKIKNTKKRSEIKETPTQQIAANAKPPSSILTNTTSHNDRLPSHPSDQPPEEIEDRLIYVDIEICHKINDIDLPDTVVDTDDIANILYDTFRHAEYNLNIPPTTVTNIAYINTSQYKNNNNDNFSTFKASVATYEETDRRTLNSIINALDEYFSAQRPGYSTKNYTPLSENPWCKFSSISLPPVNNHKEKTVGLLLGLSPDIHGKHRKCCNWILLELFNNIQHHLPPHLSQDFLAFRFHYGIRAGNFRASKKFTTPAYHIHCSSSETLHTLEQSIANFANCNNSLPYVYNNGVTTSPFPPNDKDRTKNSVNIGTKLDNAKRKTRGTIRVKIPHPLLHVLNTDITEKIETLQHLTTYCFFLDRNRFYLILYFDANPETSQYSSKKELSRLTDTFVDFLEMNNSSTSNNTYSFPDREEANTTMNNTLMSMLDDNTTKPPPTSSKKDLLLRILNGKNCRNF